MLYVILLVFLFLVLFALEFFVPSGGVIGLCAAAALIAAVVIAFLHSATMGLATLLVGMVLVPMAFAIMIRLWPRTSIGRGILGTPVVAERRSQYQDYLNRVGIAKTDLLPSGMVEIDGRRLDAVSTGVAVDKGTVIEVISVDGGRIHVRPTERPLPSPAAPRDDSGQGPSLETPVDSLGLDDLSDPLG
ncbi:NfeD family protein [Roseimaritima sediminicola]|uniref:NfeD family protein n=1 Tax=Roseimaritima sediminicola TaxID=2662066 RepID=UPI0012985458|nr:NfeD family protein [Roseimaritima sediminicola]